MEEKPIDMFPRTDAIKNSLQASVSSTRSMLRRLFFYPTKTPDDFICVKIENRFMEFIYYAWKNGRILF
jgi:hypothetical protein